jgi:hypothetical protein
MTNNRIVVVILLSWLLFFPAIGWGPLLYVLDVINALGFTFGAAVLWRYIPGAIWALRGVLRGKPIGRGSMLVLGIVQTWAAMVIRTCTIWQWRWLGEPNGGLDSVSMAVAAFLIIGGGACHAQASTMTADNVQVPELSAKLLWSALASGLILGAGIAYGRWEMDGEAGHAHLLVRLVAVLLGATLS